MLNILLFIGFIYLVTFLLTKVKDERITQFIPEFIGIIGILYQLVINRRESFKLLGFNISSLKVYSQGFLTICGVLLTILAVGYLFAKVRIKKDIRSKKYLILFVKLFLLNTVAAVFTEELVFRGIVQRQLLQYFPPLYAIVVASFIFGIWHIPFIRSLNISNSQIYLYPLGVSLLGVILGFFYYKSQSLIVAGFLHGLWNGIIYTVWGVGGIIKGIFEERKDALNHPEYGYIGITVLILSVSVLLIIWL